MTDTTQGSVEDTGNSASPGNGNDGTQQDSPVVSSAGWLSGLAQPENRELAAKKGWDKANSPDVVFASYRELEGRLGRSVILPGEKATRADYDQFAKRVGRPDQPDGYRFKLPQKLPETLPYDDKSATEFKVWSHEAGLAPWQAQSLHDRFIEKQVQLAENAQTNLSNSVHGAHSDIVKKWGPTDSPSYQSNVKFAARALENLQLSDTFRAHGLLAHTGEVTDANLAFALATVGKGLFTEDKHFGGPGNLTENNPWKAGQENLTEQGRLVRQDPDLARSLIVAAGKDPNKELLAPPR